MEALTGEKWTTIKQYAEERGISQPAVSQSMRTKRTAPLLEGHVRKDGPRYLLDEEAVRILDAARDRSVVLVDSKEGKEQDEQEKQALRDEIADLKEQLRAAVDLSKTLGETVKTVTEEKKLLEDRKEEFLRAQILLEDKTAKLEQETERADAAESLISQIKTAGFFARRRLIKNL